MTPLYVSVHRDRLPQTGYEEERALFAEMQRRAQPGFWARLAARVAALRRTAAAPGSAARPINACDATTPSGGAGG